MLTNVSKIFELITLLVSYCFTFVSVLPKKEQNKTFLTDSQSG